LALACEFKEAFFASADVMSAAMTVVEPTKINLAIRMANFPELM
jgi:hypothetical protein